MLGDLSGKVAVVTDIGDEASVVEGCCRIVAEHGVPWTLVNNAAVQDREHLLEAEAGEWDRILRINIRGPLLIVGAWRRGRIVNIASMAVRGQLVVGHALYASSKAALLGPTHTSALERAPHGITVNTLLPGGVLTWGAMSSAGPAFEGPALRPAPLGMCEPRDIAAAVLFLVTPAACFVTNQTLAVDAGWSAA